MLRFRFFRYAGLISFAFLSTAGIAAGPLSAETLVLLDGTRQKMDVTGINAEGEIAVKSGPFSTDLMGLRRIDRDVSVSASDQKIRIYLRGDATIACNAVTIDGSDLVMSWAYGRDYRLPLSLVNGILFDVKGSEQDGLFREKLADPVREKDWLFVPREDNLLSLEGAVSGLTEEKLAFVWNDEERTVDRSRTYGLILATTARSIDYTGMVRVTMADGSGFWGKLKSLNASGKGELEIQPGGKADLVWTVPWRSVASIEVRSDRMVFLSDIEPAAVEMSTLFTFTGWERDRNVLRRPITMDKTTYEKGIGAIAVCRLTYEAGGNYDELAAIIGIDDQTKGRGDCEFVVIGDGKELLRERLKGSDEAKPIRVDIRGVRRVTLGLEMGDNTTVGDHGNWADARFIRKQEN